MKDSKPLWYWFWSSLLSLTWQLNAKIHSNEKDSFVEIFLMMIIKLVTLHCYCSSKMSVYWATTSIHITVITWIDMKMKICILGKIFVTIFSNEKFQNLIIGTKSSLIYLDMSSLCSLYTEFNVSFVEEAKKFKACVW